MTFDPRIPDAADTLFCKTVSFARKRLFRARRVTMALGDERIPLVVGHNSGRCSRLR
jgi:hypothetical protein